MRRGPEPTVPLSKTTQKVRRTLSIYCMAWALRQSGLDPSTKFVLCVLADHADDDGICWPGQKGIAEKVGTTTRQVQRHIAKLVQSKLISTERLKTQGGHLGGNKYYLNLPKMSHACDISVVSDTTPVSSPESPYEPSLPSLSTYGEFGHVQLTGEEYRKLSEKLNGSLQYYIDKFDRWAEQNPGKAKGRKAYLTIPDWFDRWGPKEKGGGPNGRQQPKSRQDITRENGEILRQRFIRDTENKRRLQRGTKLGDPSRLRE